MEPIREHTGIIALLNLSNVDTDQIISKEFLKSIKRTGFGEHLFHHWRYKDNQLDTGFELNNPAYAGASILLTGNNFGCGSSREHAVWAIQQFGFKVLIAYRKPTNHGMTPAFADIFRNNCLKNGLLLIDLEEGSWQQIVAAVQHHPGLSATVDLTKQTLQIKTTPPIQIPFEIEPAAKEKLLQGLDDIGMSEQHSAQITAFENGHDNQLLRSPYSTIHNAQDDEPRRGK